MVGQLRQKIQLVTIVLNFALLFAIFIAMYTHKISPSIDKQAGTDVVKYELRRPCLEVGTNKVDLDSSEESGTASGTGSDVRTMGLDASRDTEIQNLLIQQRNSISRLLNQRQQKLGELQCKMQDSVHERGGYCRKEAEDVLKRPTMHIEVFDQISLFMKGKTAASFGVVAGLYAKRMIDSGHLTEVAAYDGNPFCNETSEGRVQFLDLSVPQYGLPVYDWIISIEVAEHIPPQFEHIYLDNIARHAIEGVILSWAGPQQKGVTHVNARRFEYVNDRMKAIGFVHANEQSVKLQTLSRGNLKKLINVYVREKDLPNTELFS